MFCQAGFDQWLTTIMQHLPDLSKPQATVLALWSLGMVLARSCALTAVTAFLAPWVRRPEQTVRQQLREWCDEASVVHWCQESPQPPSWDEVHRHMQRDGRLSVVNHHSLAHRSYKIPLTKVRPGQELRLK